MELGLHLSELDRKQYFIADDKKLDGEEAVFYLIVHLNKAIANALKAIKVEKKDLLVAKQIEISNNLLR